MTTLGKILVFVNLLFSLAVGALIILVFFARTNWKHSFDTLTKYYEISQANVKSYAQEVKETKDAYDKKIKDMDDSLNRKSAELTKVEKERDKLRDDNNKDRKSTRLNSSHRL